MAKHIKKISMADLGPLVSDLVSSGGEVRLTVVGNSMFPTMRNGIDSVVVKKKDKIKKYDIPLYKRDSGEYILHRIVEVKGEVFSCSGDNQKVVESPVYKEQIIGCVSGFYRNKKYISCDNLFYRLYSFLWINFKIIRPVAYKLIKLRRRMKK